MFKLVKEGESHLIILDEPIKISNSENIIEYFDLNKLNDEEESTIGTFNIFKNLMVAPNINTDKYSILADALNNDKITLKYKMAYEEENILLKIITEYYKSDEISNTEEYIEIIDTKSFMEDTITSLRINNYFFIYDNKLVYEAIESFKKNLYLEFLADGKYIEIDNELCTEAEVYQYNNDEKKVFFTTNRLIFHHSNSILCLCETIKQNKLNFDNTLYTIRVKIDETKELVLKDIELIQCINEQVSYMTFDLHSVRQYHEDIFIRNIENEYCAIKDKDLNYTSCKDYKSFDIKSKNKFNEAYNSEPLFKMTKYLKTNNSENAIKKYIKSNKIKAINNININNYLLYKGLFL